MYRLHWHGLPLFLLGLLVYALVMEPIKALPRPQQSDTLRVALPGYIEVLLMGGDRHLAADIGVFRAMMVGGNVKDYSTYEVQGKIQRQVAILNPRHEDNNYIAAAILPWWDQVDAAQFVLARATESRYWDYMPPFFQGFNEFYFNKDFDAAAQLVELSASRASGVNREAFRDIAAKWYARGDDPRSAIGVITALKQASRDPNMQRRLQARIERLQGLLVLREAAQRYRDERGEGISDIEQLQVQGFVDSLPIDPFRLGYEVDKQGEIQLRSKRRP